MGEQKRRQQLDPGYGKPTQFSYQSCDGKVVKPLNCKPPNASGFPIKVEPFMKIEEVPASLLRQAREEGVNYADFCAPVFVESVVFDEGSILPIVATTFPRLNEKGIISIEAMYACGINTNLEITSMVTLALVVPSIEAEINYLVATAFKKFLEENQVQKQVKDLAPGDLVRLNTGTEKVKRIIPDTPNCPEWRVQWAGLSSNLIARVDFLPTEWVTLDG